MNNNDPTRNYFNTILGSEFEFRQESKNDNYPFEILRFSQVDNDILRHSFVYLTCGISGLDQPGVTTDGKFKNIEFSAYSDYLIKDKSVENPDLIANIITEVALFPFKNSTAFEQGQTFDFGRPLMPNSELEGFYFSAPPFVKYPDLFSNTKRVKTILHLIPISRKEMEFKLKHGISDFLDLMGEKNVEPFMDLKRKSSI